MLRYFLWTLSYGTHSTLLSFPRSLWSVGSFGFLFNGKLNFSNRVCDFCILALPRLNEVRPVEHHDFRQRQLSLRIIPREVIEAPDEGCAEKVRKVLAMNTSLSLKREREKKLNSTLFHDRWCQQAKFLPITTLSSEFAWGGWKTRAIHCVCEGVQCVFWKCAKLKIFPHWFCSRLLYWEALYCVTTSREKIKIYFMFHYYNSRQL